MCDLCAVRMVSCQVQAQLQHIVLRVSFARLRPSLSSFLLAT